MAEPDGSTSPIPARSILTKDYRVLLVLAALIGVMVSLASWGFLELVIYIQQMGVRGPSVGPWVQGRPPWWPLPVLGVAGPIVAVAVTRLPGRGGHLPAEGLKAGPPTEPIELPGLLLAALASIGLGLVLGPEAPLIGLATGLAILAVRLAREGCARSGPRPAGRRRGVRRRLVVLRLAHRRGGHHHRGQRFGRADPSGHLAPGPDRRRLRFARSSSGWAR